MSYLYWFWETISVVPQLFLEEQNFSLREAQRTLRQRVRLYLLRFILNVIVLCLLGGAFYLIHFAIKKSQIEARHWTSIFFTPQIWWRDWPYELFLSERTSIPLDGQSILSVPPSHHHHFGQPVPASRVPQDVIIWRLLVHHTGQHHACKVRGSLRHRQAKLTRIHIGVHSGFPLGASSWSWPRWESIYFLSSRQ